MIILDMKKPSSCETCPLHWNEQGMMCCSVTHDVVRENCPIKAEIPDNATNERIKDVVNVMLNSIRAEIEHLHYHPKLDFIKNDEVVEMALDIIDKYKEDKE